MLLAFAACATMDDIRYSEEQEGKLFVAAFGRDIKSENNCNNDGKNLGGTKPEHAWYQHYEHDTRSNTLIFDVNNHARCSPSARTRCP